MGRHSHLQNLLNSLKDKASITKTTLLSKPSSSHLAILKATTHDPTKPPNENHLNHLLSFGHSSRLTASSCIESLMDRLHTTQNSSVALKCLIIVHNIITRGSFILQDQLSIYPVTGGRNYLNLSNFRDNSGPESWQLSSWVRWYARLLEQFLFASRILGFFLSSKVEERDKVSSLSNGDLLKELEALVGVVEEIYRAPVYMRQTGLVGEVVRLVADDDVAAQMEILVRVKEVRERLGVLSFGESVELVCILKRLENCKDRLLLLEFGEKGKEGRGDLLMGMVSEIKEKIGMVKEEEEGRKVGRRGKGSESARMWDRVVKSDDSLRFSSGRMSSVSDVHKTVNLGNEKW